MKARIALIVLLTAGILAGSGCTTSVIGPEGQSAASYRFGKLRDTLSVGIVTAYEASLEAAEGLGLKVTQANQDQLEGKIIARTVEDDRIMIELIAITDRATKLTIDTGSLAKARRVYQAILDNVATAGPTQL